MYLLVLVNNLIVSYEVPCCVYNIIFLMSGLGRICFIFLIFTIVLCHQCVECCVGNSKNTLQRRNIDKRPTPSSRTTVTETSHKVPLASAPPDINTLIILTDDQRLSGKHKNITVTQTEGEHLSYTCRGNKNTALGWHHMDSAQNTISQFKGNTGYMLRLNMRLHIVDNETLIRCYDSNQKATVYVQIIVTKSHENKNVTQNSSEELVYLKPNDRFSFKRVSKSFTWLKSTGNHIGFLQQDFFIMTPEDNDTTIICITWRTVQSVYGASDLITGVREICNLTHLYLKNTYADSANWMVEALGASGALLLVLLAIYAYCCLYKRKRRREAGELYATARVQYAALQLEASNTTRKPIRNDTPYAEVIGVLEPKNK
ncbi:hypothetical protein ACJJTC_019159 [Scirpophaga incertulas]